MTTGAFPTGASGRNPTDRLRRLLVTALLFCTGAGPALAVELLYVYAPDCPACRKFDAEAGRIYPKTPEARAMPMRRIRLSDWQAGRAPERACAAAPVVGTPTFLLVHDCSELERITGYSTDEGFWMGLARMRRIVQTQLPPTALDDRP